jgi:FlaA1/EpsC-like NDP-sugar epimerase
MATVISTNFASGIGNIIYSQIFSFIFPVIIFLTYVYKLGFYKSIIKFFDSRDSIFVSVSGSLLFGFSWAVFYIFQFSDSAASYSTIIILQGLLLASVLYAFINISRDVAKYLLYPYFTNDDAKPVIIYGAGRAGNELYQSLLLDPSKRVLAFFDDSKNLKNQLINNIPILGSFKKIIQLKESFSNLEVLLAIPSIKTEQRREIIGRLEYAKIAVRTVPSFNEILSDEKKLSDIQNLSLDDLLPRARVSQGVISNAENFHFFVTGAGGSIGSEIVRQLLRHAPKSIILFDISEINLYVVERECRALANSEGISTDIIPILGDVRDLESLRHLFKKFPINFVYHAAAYKHVPLVEDINNIVRAAENNIIGTYNLASVSLENRVSSFVMISTDKAVRPSNIMGASKRLAEMIIQSLSSNQANVKFSMVRFGNVINSSGSVIPLFLDQISKGGPVTVTDKNVTRYFMTIPEASNLVLQAGQMSEGGEVFILDMGEQLKIYDLAKKLIHLSGRNIAENSSEEGIEITEVGLRPGEKMYEELLISGDQLRTDNPKIFKSIEKYPAQKIMESCIDEISNAIKLNDYIAITKIFENYVEGFIYDDKK